MSGGKLEYSRYRLEEIINTIEEEINNNEKPPYDNPDNEWDRLENERFFAEGWSNNEITVTEIILRDNLLMFKLRENETKEVVETE